MYGCEAEGAARAANTMLSPLFTLLPPHPQTPCVSTHTVGFPGGLACPWSGSTAASMKAGGGEEAKTQLSKWGQFMLPQYCTAEK